MTFQPDPRKFPTAKKVVDAFKAENYDPEGYTLYTYAAVQVWAQAATAAGSLDMEKVAAKVRGGTFDTVIGKISIDDKGDVKNPEYVWYVWHNGKYAEK
jgi:branched-chain amino acid transport system substrate-binding protein